VSGSAGGPAPERVEHRVVERFVVERNYDGWRLDRYLTEKLKRATRSLVTRLLQGAVRFADGRRVKPGTRVRPGDVVLVERTERPDPGAPALEAVRVLDARGDVVVLDKPAGLLVHRTARESVRTVEAFLAERYAGERVEPVHRLDRDTSGCLVCARGAEAIRRLRAAFAEESLVTKRYLAVATDPGGRWPAGARERLETPLGFDAESRVELRIGRGEWRCATEVVVESRPRPELACLRVRLEGGRQHQIRAHLALEGTPVLGDKLYGMGDAFFLAWTEAPGAPELVAQLPLRWHALHAVEVALAPGLASGREATSGSESEAWRVVAPVPPHFPGRGVSLGSPEPHESDR
jgi:RluA family pseudouridine synthase